ncbi:hypothetical protein EYF80_046562 [Liparis tanakae]|uniref:Uncharacterized protein n=1 Tax=Liparis tanakae TaxID=230148 RepID=A0A4Z2FPS2_9TELE|nr:hypothetical protein EYF80_046562 [Liparis tanakae]
MYDAACRTREGKLTLGDSRTAGGGDREKGCATGAGRSCGCASAGAVRLDQVKRDVDIHYRPIAAKLTPYILRPEHRKYKYDSLTITDNATYIIDQEQQLAGQPMRMSFAHGPSARDREVLEAASDAFAPAGERLEPDADVGPCRGQTGAPKGCNSTLNFRPSAAVISDSFPRVNECTLVQMGVFMV